LARLHVPTVRELVTKNTIGMVVIERNNMPSKIILRYLDGKDKISLLNEVLDLSDFEETIEAVRKSQGKDRADFNIKAVTWGRAQLNIWNNKV